MTLVLVGIVYVGSLLLHGFFGGPAPVASNNLVPGAHDFGSLTVLIFGKGQPLSNVEVDIGTVGERGPTGPMSYAVTDAHGAATFEKVPVGNFNIFFNTNHFPAAYQTPLQSALPSVHIVKDQPAETRIDLAPQ